MTPRTTSVTPAHFPITFFISGFEMIFPNVTNDHGRLDTFECLIMLHSYAWAEPCAGGEMVEISLCPPPLRVSVVTIENQRNGAVV